MADVTGNEILKDVRGSIGGITLYKVGSRTFAKSKPQLSASAKRGTSAQQAHRTKFQKAAGFAKVHKSSEMYLDAAQEAKSQGVQFTSAYQMALKDYMNAPVLAGVVRKVDTDDVLVLVVESVTLKAVKGNVVWSEGNPTENCPVEELGLQPADDYLTIVDGDIEFNWTAWRSAYPSSSGWHWLTVQFEDFPGNVGSNDINIQGDQDELAPLAAVNLTRYFM
jgi:hypothetical protein